MNYLLGVDLGTSGTKTVLFDEDGNVVASKTIEYPLLSEKNGWAEQEPLDWWNAAADTIHAVITESGVDNKDIKGLGISGQMHGLVMLDKDGQRAAPLHHLVRPAHGKGVRGDHRTRRAQSA